MRRPGGNAGPHQVPDLFSLVARSKQYEVISRISYQPRCVYAANERQGYVTARIHTEFAGQLLLAECDDADLIAGAETIFARVNVRQRGQP